MCILEIVFASFFVFVELTPGLYSFDQNLWLTNPSLTKKKKMMWGSLI